MIYLDMDGVLMQYSYETYKNPNWCSLGAHVFRNMKPYKYMPKIIEDVAHIVGRDNIYILTNICSHGDGDIAYEQITDKLASIARYYPSLSLCNFIACDSDKRDTLSRIKGMRLTNSDILIDDYHVNLGAWISSGGTAIKAINDINSKSYFPGRTIDVIADTTDAVEIILSTWYENR